MSYLAKLQTLQKTVRVMIDNGDFQPKTYTYSKPIPKLTPEKMKMRVKENGIKVRKPRKPKTENKTPFLASQPVTESVSYAMPMKLTPPMLSGDELQAEIENAKTQIAKMQEKRDMLRDTARLIYLSAMVGKKPKNISESIVENLLQAKLREYRNQKRGINSLSTQDSVFIFTDEQTETLIDIRLDMQALSQHISGLRKFVTRHTQFVASKNETPQSRKQKMTKAEKRKALQAENAKMQTVLNIMQRESASKIASEIIKKGKQEKEKQTRSAKIDNGLFYAIVRLANGEIRIEASSNDESKIAFSNIASCLKTVQLSHIIPSGKTTNRYKQIMGIFRDFCPNGLIVEEKPDVCIVQSKTVPTSWPNKPYKLSFKPKTA